MATTRILLKKSGLKGRLPAPTSAEYGELFINYHSGSPMLSFKNNANEIVSIKPVSTIDGGAGETPPGTGNSIGDLIYDGTNLLVWNGTSWEKVGVADLSYTAKVDGGTVVSANGTDAEIPLVGVNAGLMSPGDKTLLGSLPIDGSGNFEQVQSNWDEVDAGSPAYINNKPDIPTNTSDLTNDGDGTSDFVTFDDISGLGSGSVTSVDSGNGLDGGPITTSGTLSVKADGDTITVSADGVKVTDNKFAAPGDIPTNTSDLTNDGDGTSNFVTFDDIGGLGGGSVTSVGSGDGLTGGPVTTTGTLSVLADGDTIAVSAAGIKVAEGKFAAPSDLPTNTSDLTNDGENGSDPFITANELPTKTSELTNDGANGSDPFITANDLPPSGIQDAPSDGQLYGRQDGDWEVVTGGSGDTTIEYSGAAAWGEVGKTTVNGPCIVQGSLNVASVTRTQIGIYEVVFQNPMPSADYSVVGSTAEANTFVFSTYNRTATGFGVQLSVDSGRNDWEFCFTVFATNALPPRGGTGADCWVSCNSDGTIQSSFNVASTTRTSTGLYDVVFTTPMPSADYSVLLTIAAETYSVVAYNTARTVNGFSIEIANSNNQHFDFDFSAVVHATNAQLPDTITMQMWDDLVARVTALENP